MADVIAVHPGALPWLPAENVETVAEYDRFDVPTLGVIRQHGVSHLFRCIAGLGTPVTIWWYSLISDDDRRQIEDADDIDTALASVVTFPAVVAIAAEGYGIVAARDVGDFEEPKVVLGSLFDSLEGWIEEFRGAAHLLRDRDLIPAS